MPAEKEGVSPHLSQAFETLQDVYACVRVSLRRATTVFELLGGALATEGGAVGGGSGVPVGAPEQAAPTPHKRPRRRKDRDASTEDSKGAEGSGGAGGVEGAEGTEGVEGAKGTQGGETRSMSEHVHDVRTQHLDDMRYLAERERHIHVALWDVRFAQLRCGSKVGAALRGTRGQGGAKGTSDVTSTSTALQRTVYSAGAVGGRAPQHVDTSPGAGGGAVGGRAPQHVDTSPGAAESSRDTI